MSDGEDASIVSIGTTGPDTYADGTTVLDGECYALVWTKNGATFGGFNLDGRVVTPATDVILYAGSLAKGGCCPKTAFVIDKAVLNALKSSGSFALYLLDTRTYVDATSSSRRNKEGANSDQTRQDAASTGDASTVVLGSSVQGSKVVATAAQLAMTGAVGGAADAGVFAPSAVTDAPMPKIVGIRIEGNEVVLTVENTLKALNYNVAAGEKPDALADGAAKSPVTGTGATIELRVPKTGDAQFFRVKRN